MCLLECSLSLPRSAVGWSAVCDCCISWSYSLAFGFYWVDVQSYLILCCPVEGTVSLSLFVCLFDSLRPSQQSFSYVGTGLPGLNQY